MSWAELLLALAGIAGVFVGFGALISATSGGASELWLIRNVVSQGLLVIAASLVPAVVGQFGLEGHDLWLPSAIFVLLLDWAATVLMHVRREDMAFRVIRERPIRAVLGLVLVLLELPAQLALLLVVLGPLPDREAALYVAAVALSLFEAAVLLVLLVFSQGGRREA